MRCNNNGGDLVIESLHQAPVRLLGELASLEASKYSLRSPWPCWAFLYQKLRSGWFWHKGLRHTTKFEQNSAPTQGAHFHQVIFLHMSSDRPIVAIRLPSNWLRQARSSHEYLDFKGFDEPLSPKMNLAMGPHLVRKDSILSTWETRSFQRHFLKLPYLSGMREKMRFTRQVYLHWTRRLEGSLSQINEHDSFTSIDAKLSTKRKRTVTT